MARFSTDHPLLSGYSGRMFVVLTLGMAAITLARNLLPPLLPAIIEALAITPFKAGIALSLMSVGFSLMQYPSGRLADGLGSKTVLVAAFGLAACGLLALSLVSAYWQFLLAILLLGVGQGLFPTVAQTMLSDLFDERLGQAFGIHFSSIDVGGIAGAGLAAAALAVGIWQAAFLPVAVALVLLLLLLQRWSAEPFVVARVSLKLRSVGGQVFRNRRVRLLLAAYVLQTATIRGFVGFFPTFLQVEHGFSPGLASAAFAGLFVLGLVYKPLGGLLSDRFHRPLVGTAVVTAGAIGLVVLVTADTVWAVFLGMAIWGVGHKSFIPVMHSYLLEQLTASQKGSEFGAVRTVYMGLGALGPTYVGYVAGRASYSLAYTGFIAVFLVIAVITVWLLRHE